jgi:hypothetical protein
MNNQQNNSFWRKRASKIITYDIKGKVEDRYHTVKRQKSQDMSNIENYRPRSNFIAQSPSPPKRSHIPAFSNPIISNLTQTSLESPVKREIASKMVSIMKDLGNEGKINLNFRFSV